MGGLTLEAEGSELYGPPRFEPGDRVRATRPVRNDGTHPEAARGAQLIAAGDEGYVKSIGTYLNRFYVYAVDFADRGLLVGMRGGELEGLP